MTNKLCKCGCGRLVVNNKNRYIVGHNQKGKLRPEHEKRKISNTMKTLLSNPKTRRIWEKNAWIGRPHSEETKRKISKLRKGAGNGMYGKKRSLESILKGVLARAGYHHSEKTKAKMSAAKKGKVFISKKQRSQISKTLKKYYRKHRNAFLGRRHSEESKQKIRKANLGRFRGEKGPNWQGGKHSIPYAKGWTPWFIEEIRIRDNHRCQNLKCKNPHELLDVHHIDYDKENHSQINLITLCKRCHGKTQKKRAFWKTYYQKIMIERFPICRFVRTSFLKSPDGYLRWKGG